MSSRDTIQEELRSIESSLPVVTSPSFSVPEAYFDRLAATILAKVKSSDTSASAELSELSPLLAGIPKITPYSVPSSFFEENLQNVPVFDADIESPLLNAVGKNLLYELPANYFDNLSAQVLAKVSPPKAKVVPLFARTWMRTASAAAVAGALIFGGLQIFGNHQTADGTVQINNDAALATVAKTSPAIAREIKKASTKELEEFVENTPVSASATAKKTPASKEEEKELLKDVSVNEMENFLSTVPQSEDELAATDQP